METFEEIVGGPVEIGCYLPQRVLLIRQENGKAKGLPLNRPNPCAGRDCIAGTFLLCSLKGRGFASLSNAQREEFQAYFSHPGTFAGAMTAWVTPEGGAST